MLKWLWAGLLAAAVVTMSYAQVGRLLPANGKLGELVGQQHPFPLLELDKKVVRLAPGALIYDRENRTILHNQVPPYSRVLFVQDGAGQILRIYILRPDELARLERTLKR